MQVSDYERGRLRLPAELAVEFAQVLGVTTDELLQPGRKVSPGQPAKRPSLKLMRRMEQIESLPLYQKRALLTTIDLFLKSARAS